MESSINNTVLKTIDTRHEAYASSNPSWKDNSLVVNLLPVSYDSESTDKEFSAKNFSNVMKNAVKNERPRIKGERKKQRFYVCGTKE